MKKIHTDTYIGIFLLIVGIIFLNISKSMPKDAASFPRIIFWMIIILSSILTIFGLFKTFKTVNSKQSTSTFSLSAFISPAIVVGISLAYIFGIKYIGFYVSTALFIPAMMLFFKEISVKRIALTTAITLLALYLIFSLFLGVIMPKALLI